jgi:glycine hydroxymethyltransferase
VVRAVLDNDFIQRYGDYTGRDLSARRYRGTRYLEAIERAALEIARSVFRTEQVELRPISGHVAGAAVLMGLCQPGDLVLEPGRDAGGHREGGKFASGSLIPLRVEYLPFNAARYNIDAGAIADLIRKHKPRMIILGSSNFLYPHPVAEIAQVIRAESPGTLLVYDGSHVMGFLASRTFQDPLREGADLVFGSTHKTLPGPQGGIIYSNRDDLMDAICEATYPALVTNHHPFRIPALALALLEMQQWGADYTGQVSANAQALGEQLEAQGVPCVCVDGCYSRSHTLLLRVAQFGKGADVSERLEAAGIITTASHLPEAWGVEGIRIGVQEITRRGAGPAEMVPVAAWIADCLRGTRPVGEIARETSSFSHSLGQVKYTWAD